MKALNQQASVEAGFLGFRAVVGQIDWITDHEGSLGDKSSG